MNSIFETSKSTSVITLALLALGLICLSTSCASAQASDYQSKFKGDDWNDSEIIKLPPAQPSKVSLDSRASSPSSVSFASSSMSGLQAENQSKNDGWPTELPRLSDELNAKASVKKSEAVNTLKVEVSESVSVISAKVAALKKAPESKVYQVAKEALAHSNFELAIPLFQMLSERAPRDPRYFYGAGLAQKASGDLNSAFPNLFMAWHLGSDQVYADAANASVDDFRKRMDSSFKLTYSWQRDDPQAVLNAGARLWKLGLTQQAVQLFEYTLKNDPIYRDVAAYNLGAIAEHNGDGKRAAQFYQWALKQRAAIQAAAIAHPEMAEEVVQMEKAFPTTYLETALADVSSNIHEGGIVAWKGWTQASSYPQYWASEVCPLCAISRTSLKYNPGQSDFR